MFENLCDTIRAFRVLQGDGNEILRLRISIQCVELEEEDEIFTLDCTWMSFQAPSLSHKSEHGDELMFAGDMA